MGLDVYLKHGESTIEEDSRKHPDHFFKLGYFRSSYNGSGFNSLMHTLGIADLYAIFQAPEDGGRFTPDWEACLARAKAARMAYNERTSGPGGKGRVSFIAAEKGQGAVATTEREALEVFREESSMERPFSGYSNQKGHFWLDGLTIKAAIPGTARWAGAGVYLIWEPQETDEGDFYDAAFEIVIETCEYVIATGNAAEYSLYWSA